MSSTGYRKGLAAPRFYYGCRRSGWRYAYEDEELEELYSMLPADAESYVFFNNLEMKSDALRFKEIANDHAP